MLCMLLFLAVIGSILGYASIIMGYGLTVVQGFVTTDGASAVVSLIPSLFLFLIGWLIKWKFFADTGKGV